jgi:competence protein ComEA
MDLNKREKIGLVIFALIIVTFVSVSYFNKNKHQDIEVIKKSEVLKQNDEYGSKKDIKVYICGEIKKPGVYTLIEGDRIVKLIDIAGGLTEKADMSSINLAMKLKDEDFIRVPEIVSNTSQTQKTSNSSINQNTSNKININTADLEQLKTLPRIGDALGQRIIDYREASGPFRDIKDINNVSGIGDKMFEGLKDKITVY